MEVDFNPNPSYMMHIDLNSCFATIEQQANPRLRGKTIAVAAYDTPSGCILAPSIEAKRFGVKTGMRVRDGKMLCPSLIVLKPDPWKYRNVHLTLRKLLSKYTNDLNPKSIDEFVLNLEDYPVLRRLNMHSIAQEIKQRIKSNIGDHLTVSIGISTNRYLAKLASGLEKPDGLVEINSNNFLETYKKLNLINLPYIKNRNAARLAVVGIFTVPEFYKADIRKLKGAFHSIAGYYWYMRLRGWEIDDVIFSRRSYGNSYALPKPLSTSPELAPIISKLVTKTSARLRKAGFKAGGVHLAMSYRDHDFWHKGRLVNKLLFSTSDIYREVFRLLMSAPYQKPVRDIAVSVFHLSKCKGLQLELFEDVQKKYKLTTSIDKINERWGDYVLVSGRMLHTASVVPDRISFGGVKELEEFTLS